MARRPRIDFAGYHHIINRGVNRGVVFESKQDKESFLKILCKSLKKHDAILHSFCLMDNHYHLLIETTSENLSLLMRQINANYAIYFNKKYQRSGHLWQGRYKSWYITNEAYLYELLRYIEHNPLRANMITRLGTYPFSSYRQFVQLQECIPCLKHSLLFQWFQTTQEIVDFFDMGEGERLEKIERVLEPIDNEALEALYVPKDKKQPLALYFTNVNKLSERNEQIKAAHKDGWSQHKIAKQVGLSQGMVNRIVNGN